MIAEIAVEGLVYHIDAPFTYSIPENFEVSMGCRVLVPFGNGNKKKQGFVLDIKSRSEIDESIKLKSIVAVLDEVPLLDDEMLSLVTYLKENTFCTLFEAAKAMLPSGIGLQYIVSFMVDETVSSSVIEKFLPDLNNCSKLVKLGFAIYNNLQKFFTYIFYHTIWCSVKYFTPNGVF